MPQARLRHKQVSGFAKAVALAIPPSHCPSMSSFIFLLLVIGSLVSVLCRLRARGAGGNGESLLSEAGPTLFRRSFSMKPVCCSRVFRRAGRPASSRASFRRASSRSAASVRFASNSGYVTHNYSMNPQNSRQSGRRSGRGSRRTSSYPRGESRQAPPRPPVKLTFWQKLKSFFSGGAKSPATNGKSEAPRVREEKRGGNGRGESRQSRPPEMVEVTSPKLYVGNLSFDAAESDLLDLFNGVGAVRNAEIVTNKFNDKSKGFGFVTMASVDEAKRAVLELHDKDFLGRKLVVSGAKTSDREPDYRG